MRLALALALPLALVACACGPSEAVANTGGAGGTVTTAASSTTLGTTGSTSSGSTTTGSQGVPPPPECPCTEDSGYCEGVPGPSCGREQLCPSVVTDCEESMFFYGCIGQDILIDPEAMNCALEALANGTPGWFDVREQDLEAGSCGFEGCEWHNRRIEILDSERVLTSYCHQLPLTEPDGSSAMRSLETPAYFEACAEQPSDGAKLDCLLGGLTSGTLIACGDP